MGLDAVVYRNRRNVDVGTDEHLLLCNAYTGELYFEDEQLSRKYRNQRL
jgi:hypothetical protein